MNLALFDIDGTLVTGRSEVMFWRFLFRHGRQGPRQLLAWANFGLRHLPAEGARIARVNKAYLSRLEVEDVESLAAEFVRGELAPIIFAPAVRRLQDHVRQGDTVVLLSGTLEPVARALAQHLGGLRVCATQCAVRDGIYRARAPVRHPFGHGKLTLGKALAAELGFDLPCTFAYGDSHHDLPLLSAVGHPVAVRPDPELTARAQDRGWEILTR